MIGTPRVRLGALALLLLIPVLGWVPTMFQPAIGVASAAAVQGYASPVAYHGLLVWTLGVLAAALLIGRREPPGESPSVTVEGRPATGIERVGAGPWWIALVMFLAYFPWALARTGPFGEDALMLGVLQRMHEGQVPYRDFEFLYGPLLIYPAYWWQQLAGFSLLSYYGIYALLQAAGFAVLAVLTVRTVGRGARRHWWALLLLAPFFLDTLAGINWFGLRRLLPLLLLVWVARSDGRWHRHITAGIGGGLLLAYSHDYAAAALLAMAAWYLLDAVHARSIQPVLRGAVAGALAIVTWFLVTGAILGTDGRAAYIGLSRELVGRFSLGEAGFAFYWTASALALFGLLTLALVRVGSALPHLRRAAIGPGDRLLLMGVVYAAVLLKAGLNRADTYHLTPPFLGLVFAVVLLPPRDLFKLHSGELAVARVLVAIAAVATLVANLPSGSRLARGLVGGSVGLFSGIPTGPRPLVSARLPALVNDQQDPDSALVALARYLARTEYVDRAVYFYAATYAVPPLVGVPKRHFINDDFMYSNERGFGERAYLEQHPDALVVITDGQWHRLQGQGGTPTDEYAEYLRPTVTKRLISVLSSVHYRGVPDELALRESRWRETVGNYVTRGYRELARFGNLVILEPIRAGTPR